MQTAHGSIDAAINAMRAGAADFVVKPASPERLEVSINSALKIEALQGEIDPVGAKRPVKVDFRLVSATNRDMIQLVKDGKFREDLYYRLNVFPIWVPPLRDRLEDVPGLAMHFLARFAAEEGRRVTGISKETLELLTG